MDGSLACQIIFCLASQQGLLEAAELMHDAHNLLWLGMELQFIHEFISQWWHHWEASPRNP